VEKFILDIFEEWKNNNNLIDVNMDDYGDNSIVFTAQFIFIAHMLGYKFRKEFIDELLSQFFDKDGFRHRVNNPSKVKFASHDNMTAILSLSYVYDLKYHKEFKYFNKFLHPRDFFYYMSLKYKYLQPLFIPLCGLFMLSTCARSIEKYPGSFVTWIKSFNAIKEDVDVNVFNTYYNTYNDRTIRKYTFRDGKEFSQYRLLSTSTKLLCFIRFSTLNFGFIQKKCEKILMKTFGPFIWYDLMHIYFRNKYHPNVRLIHEFYKRRANSDSPIQ